MRRKHTSERRSKKKTRGINEKLHDRNDLQYAAVYYCKSCIELDTAMENKLNACENRWLRRILRIKYTDGVSNAELRVRIVQGIAENAVRKR